MSSGIRRKTRRAFVCLVALVLLSSCHESSHLNQPSTLPVPSAIPYFLTAGASVGLGDDAGRATISVKVQNVEGGPMQDVPVKFETDQGTIDPANAMTLADGTARALLTASVTATVMISTRTLSQRLLVTAQAPPGAPPGTPTPPPVPPTPGTTPLTVAMAAAPAPSGSETNFSFSTNGAVVQEVWTFGDRTPSVTWAWDFDGNGMADLVVSGTPSSNMQAYTYVSTATTQIKVTVTDTSTGRTAIGVLPITIAP